MENDDNSLRKRFTGDKEIIYSDIIDEVLAHKNKKNIKDTVTVINRNEHITKEVPLKEIFKPIDENNAERAEAETDDNRYRCFLPDNLEELRPVYKEK